MNDLVRVLVVDDSAYNRRTIIKMLESVPGVKVVGYAYDGEEGLRKVFDLKPDLITLDLEMPRMDGFSFLRILMQNRPTPVIVVSARSEDDNVFKALEFGAVEFISKPTASVSPELFKIRDDLVRKVRQIARTDMQKILGRSGARAENPRDLAPRSLSRPDRGEGAEVVMVGASTGGPPALQTIFSAVQQPIPVSFAISQHMPPGFTRAFAERLNKFSALEISEAKDGDIMRPGRVLVAPGGKNLLFHRQGDQVLARIAEPESTHRYIPSVDAMFTSASEVYGSKVLGVVLTGMGNDGADGVREIKNRSGQAIAEAEETSVVFGMPKEAIATGQVDKVVALPLVCREILRRCGF